MRVHDMGEGVNTRLQFLYRDAENFKTYTDLVISGRITENQVQDILSCLYEGEWFLPDVVGLEGNRPESWDDTVDHPWFELCKASFSYTNRKPDYLITPDELVANFKAAAPNWEELAFEVGDVL